MLTPFGRDIWIAAGPVVTAGLGFRYPTRMAVIRLAGGGLFVWSPVALTKTLKAQVNALGEVRHLVAPNSLHDLFIGDWKQAWPAARMQAAPGLKEKRTDLAFDGVLTDTPPADWAGEIEQVVVGGNTITTEVVFYHLPSRTAIFTDLLQQLPEGWYSGWRAFVAKWDLMVSPEPSVPRKFRLAFTRRRVARDAVRRIRDWPAEKVLMAHGTPVERDGQAVIGRAFQWLGA